MAQRDVRMEAISRFVGVVLLGCGLLLTRSVSAGDWPQILGPNRSGVAENESLAETWPKDGPKQAWSVKVGSGCAGPVVSGETLVLFHRLEDHDTLTAYHAAKGDRLWSQGFPTDFQPQIGSEDGPLAAPTIHEGKVYAYSPKGGLYCVDLKTGKPIWQKQTHAEFKVPDSYFGAGSSPLVVGTLVIVNVGGDRAGAGVVAFDRATGNVAWKSTNEQASYSSPIAFSLDGKRRVLIVERLNTVLIDPDTGKELSRTPFGQRGPTVNGAVPVLFGNRVLLTASYGIGAKLLSIGGDSLKEVWSDDVLSSQYCTPIVSEGAVYAVDGRQDGGAVTLKCFDVQSKEVSWSTPCSNYATLIAADGKLLVMQTDGALKLVALAKAKHTQLASAKLLSGTTRALPALSGGRLYVRNESTLKSVELGK